MIRADIIVLVKKKMDEYTPTGVSLPLDDFIGPILDDCARDMLLKGPLHLITPTAIPLTSVVYHDDKSYIPVPSNFLRLYEIKYPLWKKSVRVAISTEHPDHKIQENEYIKGGYGRPAVVIVTTSVNGGTVGRYFECSKVEDPEGSSLTPVALYVAEALPEGIADLFVDPMTWLCTVKLLSVFGYPDRAKMAMEQFTPSFDKLML